jgi:NADH pyrophosphatase NudC (nudix superfamily)
LAVQTCDNHPDASDPDSEVADVRWFKVSELPGLVRYQESVIHEGIEAIKAIWSSQHG